MNLVWIILAGFGSGVAASMGFGGGFVLLLYLSFFTNLLPNEAGLMNLLFFIPISGVSVLFHRKNGLIEQSVLKPCIFGGLLGILVSFLLLFVLSEAILGQLFGFLSLCVGIRSLFFAKK